MDPPIPVAYGPPRVPDGPDIGSIVDPFRRIFVLVLGTIPDPFGTPFWTKFGTRFGGILVPVLASFGTRFPKMIHFDNFGPK